MRVLFVGIILVFTVTINTFGQTDLAKQYFEKGIEFTEDRKYENALDSYQSALKFVKKDKKLESSIQYNIGVSLYQLKKFKAAEKSFNKAIRLNKKYVKAIYSLGLTKIELGELNSAEARFRKVIRLDSKHGEAYFDLGVVLMEQNKFYIAKNLFAKAIKYKSTRMDEAQKYLEKIKSLQSKIKIAEFNFQIAFNQNVASGEENQHGK